MLIYYISLQVYSGFIRLATFFSPKAKKFVEGRKNWKGKLRTLTKNWDETKKRCIWIHCASLGEFEQGRPLIEKLRKEQPNVRILLTFFSPSGYEVRKDYSEADVVIYLPLDSPQNALFFIRLVKPQLAVFIKYEFWYFYLRELDKQNIPVLSVATIFRSEQFFFRWYGKNWGKKLLSKFTYFFVQDQHSLELLQCLDISHAQVVGDTRLDRVLEIRKQERQFPLLSQIETKLTLIVGSAWESDLEVLEEGIRKLIEEHRWQVVIAPHEIEATPLIEKRFLGLTTRYTNLGAEPKEISPILIIDTIGLLAHLYRFGSVAYVGGGFGKGLHNTMEAAVYGIPILFGNQHYQKFREAKELIQVGAAEALSGDKAYVNEVLQQLVQDEGKRQEMGEAAAKYVEKNRGATGKILTFIKNSKVLDQ